MMTLAPSKPWTDGSLASLRDVSRNYKVRLGGGKSGTLRAVDGVNLSIDAGRTLGLVGESGSGKSTIARLLLRLVDVSEGEVWLGGQEITHARGRALRAVRNRAQLVFQDPYSSFDPLATINSSLAEALRGSDLTGPQKRERCAELLENVNLSPTLGKRRPRELSGGQLQRAAIARALAVQPSLIALDEPVSSLDVSSQVHIIDLLMQLQADTGVAMLFISHDLTVVRDVSDDIAVMYLGKIVEKGPAPRVHGSPQHPYTQALISSAPSMRIEEERGVRIRLRGEVPSPLDPPDGCRFNTRCPRVMDVCGRVEPTLTTSTSDRTVACHLFTEPPAVSSAADTWTPVLSLGRTSAPEEKDVR